MIIVVINIILTAIFPQSNGWGLNLRIFLAQYSYSVYLGYGIVLLSTTPHLRFSSSIMSIIVIFFVIYLITVIVSILIDTLIIKQETRILLRKF